MRRWIGKTTEVFRAYGNNYDKRGYSLTNFDILTTLTKPLNKGIGYSDKSEVIDPNSHKTSNRDPFRGRTVDKTGKISKIVYD